MIPHLFKGVEYQYEFVSMVIKNGKSGDLTVGVLGLKGMIKTVYRHWIPLENQIDPKQKLAITGTVKM